MVAWMRGFGPLLISVTRGVHSAVFDNYAGIAPATGKKCPRLTQVSVPSLTMKRSTIQWHRMGPKPTLAHSAFLCKHLCRLLLEADWLREGIWVFFPFPCPGSITLPYQRGYDPPRI